MSRFHISDLKSFVPPDIKTPKPSADLHPSTLTSNDDDRTRKRKRSRKIRPPVLQPLRRQGQAVGITSDNEPLVDRTPSDERFGEVEGKEALPTSPTPSGIYCQQIVHRGSLGLHQPLIPVVVHGLTAVRGLSQETPTTLKADVSQSPREQDPLEGLLYDPVDGNWSALGGG